jgi:hypothetical protein
MSDLIPPNPFDVVFEEWVAPFPDAPRLDMARYFRNGLLASSDWTQLADAPVDRQAWATYRQALRDFMSGLDADNPIVFPAPPTAEV